jgi:hypothetical protein
MILKQDIIITTSVREIVQSIRGSGEYNSDISKKAITLQGQRGRARIR